MGGWVGLSSCAEGEGKGGVKGLSSRAEEEGVGKGGVWGYEAYEVKNKN